MFASAVVLAVLAALGVALGTRELLRLRRGVPAFGDGALALGERVAERVRAAEQLRRIESVQRATETGVHLGNEGVRAMHAAIADIPFSVLDAVPVVRVGAAAVRTVHDVTAGGVYDAIAALNRLAGHGLRRGLRRRAPD